MQVSDSKQRGKESGGNSASGSPNGDDRRNESRHERRTLSPKMIKFVLLHFRGLDASALQNYTFEKQKSSYPNAEADIDVFDSDGKLVFQGREFHSGVAGYWRPSRLSMVPEWAPNENAWGRQAVGPSPAQ